MQKKSRFTSNLDSARYKRDECGERKRNGKKCKHRKVLLKIQLGVRNVNREVFKVGNNCFKLSIIGLYLMSWTRAWTNTAILGAARSTEKTTGLIVDKLLRLGFNIILDVGRSFKNIFFYKEKRIKSLRVKVFEKKTFLTAETHNVKPLLSIKCLGKLLNETKSLHLSPKTINMQSLFLFLKSINLSVFEAVQWR